MKLETKLRKELEALRREVRDIRAQMGEGYSTLMRPSSVDADLAHEMGVEVDGPVGGHNQPLCPHCLRASCPWLGAYKDHYWGHGGTPEPDCCPHYGRPLPPDCRRWVQSRLPASDKGKTASKSPKSSAARGSAYLEKC